MRRRKIGRRVAALAAALCLTAGLLPGCKGGAASSDGGSAVSGDGGGTVSGDESSTASGDESSTASGDDSSTVSGSGGQEMDAAVFQEKEDALRKAVLTEQVRGELAEAPAGDAGYAVFLSACGETGRARVYSGTGATLDDAWDAAAQAGREAGDPAPLWLKADVVYVSDVLPAAALDEIGELFAPYGFRYGLAFDPGYGTALLEAELNTAHIYDYEAGGVDLKRLNDYLEETGRAPLEALPKEYTAFQCAGWLCDEDGKVLRLGLEEDGYGRREVAAVDASIASALALDGAGYLAGQVQEDGSILLDGDVLDVASHADVLSAMVRGYQMLPGEELAGGIDRAVDWLLGRAVYAEGDEGDMAFLPDGGEITLEALALGTIALADCAETSGAEDYVPACTALGAGMLSMLDADAGTFTHVLSAFDLSRKEEVRSPAWDGMGVTAFCRLYGLTEDPMWLWAAQQVLDRMIQDGSGQYDGIWTAYALREVTRYVGDRADYFAFALKNAQSVLDVVNEPQTQDQTQDQPQDVGSEELEMLLVSYETYRRMLDNGYSVEGFQPQPLAEAISTQAKRQLDGYIFPEYAMYFAQPRQVLGAFMVREEGLRVYAGEMCRNIGGYSLYAVNYEGLQEDGQTE